MRLAAVVSALLTLSVIAAVVPGRTTQSSLPATSEVVPTTASTDTTIAELNEEDFGYLVVNYDSQTEVNSDRTLPVPSAGNSLDGSLPSRLAPIESNPFTYANSDEPPLTGLTEPANVFTDFQLGKNGSLECSRDQTVNRVPGEDDTDSTWISGCTVVHSSRGDFMAIARNASLNNMDRHQIAALVIEIFVQRTLSDGKKWAVEVLHAYIPNSLCNRRSVSVSKARAGDSEVLIVEDNLGETTNSILVAANDEGMPTTIAAYTFTGTNTAFGYQSTNRSIVVDSPRGYNNGRTLHEIFWSPTGWRERTHVSVDESDSLSRFTSKSEGAPTMIVRFGFPTYVDGSEWCGKFGPDAEFGY